MLHKSVKSATGIASAPTGLSFLLLRTIGWEGQACRVKKCLHPPDDCCQISKIYKQFLFVADVMRELIVASPQNDRKAMAGGGVAGRRSPALSDRKLFAGPRLRRVRAQLGLTQSRMAEELGVSVSYLNLIERNQRPLTAQFLLRLAEAFELDLRMLTGDLDDQMLVEMSEAMADGVFRSVDLPRSELQDFVQSFPAIAQAFTQLYGAYRESVSRTPEQQAGLNEADHGAAQGPLQAVRDYVQSARNHFPALDARAEALAEELRLAGDSAAGGLASGLFGGLRERLRARHGITVRVLPLDVLPESLRRFDHHRRQLQLSELLDAASRTFHCAYHLAFSEVAAEMDAVVAASGLEAKDACQLLRINLANYFAAAVMMPYGRFLAAAEQSGYDLTLLGNRFGAGFEQVCHRLTTLQRDGARGVPFFLIRIDQAGNVSKRFSAGKFHFSRYGGTCPLWAIHDTFRQPGRILRQIVEMPDGTRYFSLARTVRPHAAPWGEEEPRFAVGLGCDIGHAHHLAYARGMDLASPEVTPIGVNCTLCERSACRQRSLPPISRQLIIDERSRGPTPFRFSDS